MTHLRKADLAQMNEDYFRSLDPERFVAVAKNLHALAIEQAEVIALRRKGLQAPLMTTPLPHIIPPLPHVA